MRHVNSVPYFWSTYLNKSISLAGDVSKTAGWVAKSVDPDNMLYFLTFAHHSRKIEHDCFACLKMLSDCRGNRRKPFLSGLFMSNVNADWIADWIIVTLFVNGQQWDTSMLKMVYMHLVEIFRHFWQERQIVWLVCSPTHQTPSKKGVYSKRKESAPHGSRFLPFRGYPFFRWGNDFDGCLP